MITGKELIEKMYSENYDEYEDTKLYSTGDSDLDDLLERAFCEGYEYAQKEFGNKENKAAKRAYELSEAKKDPEIQKLRKNGTVPPSDSLSLRHYREKQRYSSDPIEENFKDSKRVRMHLPDVSSFGSANYETKFGDTETAVKRLKKIYPDMIVERELDAKRKDKLKDPKIKAKIAKQKFNRILNNTKKDISGFIKDNKKGLAIGGTLGTAALVGGGIALHKYNKKKKAKEAEENKKENKK